MLDTVCLTPEGIILGDMLGRAPHLNPYKKGTVVERHHAKLVRIREAEREACEATEYTDYSCSP